METTLEELGLSYDPIATLRDLLDRAERGELTISHWSITRKVDQMNIFSSKDLTDIELRFEPNSRWGLDIEQAEIKDVTPVIPLLD